MTEYEKFLQELETFIFVENKPEKADIIIFILSCLYFKSTPGI